MTRISRNMRISQDLLDRLMHWRTVQVAQKAAKLILERPDIIIADIGTGYESFCRFPKSLKILNHPIANHDFAREYLLEASNTAGNFSNTFDIISYPDWFESRVRKEIGLADIILVGSNFVRESFLAKGVPSSKIRVISYGTDLSMFKPKDNYSDRQTHLRLLFVGKIGERKGISYLNSAFNVLKHENVSLTMVGSAIGGQETINLLDKEIKFLQHTSHEELAKLYKAHDVFVFPSLIEGMGLVVLEAMASGLPIITTPNGPGDIVRDQLDGLHIEAKNAEQIVDAVRYFKMNRALIESMGRSASSRSKEFSWFIYRDKFMALINSL